LQHFYTWICTVIKTYLEACGNLENFTTDGETAHVQDKLISEIVS